jgi:RNA polymerase sigma-70 factor (sigma-E family)
MTGWPDQEFDAFVASRLPTLVRFAYSLTQDLGLAEDLVQTALMKSYRASRRHRLENPEAYVRRAVVTANVSRWRRPRVAEVLVDVVPEPAAEQLSDRLEQHQTILELLRELTPRQRTVIVLRYQEDWSEIQIADAMGVHVGTVKTLASRALDRLRSGTLAGRSTL